VVSVSVAYGLLWLWLMGYILYMGGLVIEARVQIFPDNIQRTKYRPIGPRKRALYANAKRPRKFDFRRALFGDFGF
jgi:hypothetical protein